MQDLAGKVAVITGGGSGIGRGIALTLAREAMVVAVADIRPDAAAAVAGEIVGAGGTGFAVEVDVTSVDSLEAAEAEIESRAGPVNLLCANAGVLRIASLDQHTIEDWEYTLSVNVLGVVKTVKAFLPQLRQNAPDAHIVNTASLGGLVSVERFPIGAYTASKYACVGFSEMLRGELAAEGIGVSVLCPGVVESNLAQTSGENRPAAYGEHRAPEMAGSPAGAQPAAGRPPQAMAALAVGPIVVRAIRENRLHILTHPQSRPLVERRFEALLDDFDFAESAN